MSPTEFLLGLTVCFQFSLGGGEKFDYGLFEDPVTTRAAYLAEQNILQELSAVRRVLNKRMEAIEKVLSFETGSFESSDAAEYMGHPIHALKVVNRTFQTRMHLTNYEGHATDISKISHKIEHLEEDMRATNKISELDAALKGIVTLKDTYDLNVEAMVRGSQDNSGLDYNDLYLMAGTAVNMNWYDTSIKLLRDAISREKEEDEDVQFWQESMEKLQRTAVELNNQNLVKKRKTLGESFKTLPYVVNGTDLSKKQSQPKFLKQLVYPPKRDPQDVLQYATGEVKEEHGRRICRADLVGSNIQLGRCHFLHQDDPFLRLGPHKMEVLQKDPFRMIFHEFLSEDEIDFLITYSVPRLSTQREKQAFNRRQKKHDYGSKQVRVVSKTVQCWIDDVRFNKTSSDSVTALSSNDYDVVHQILLKLSRKIEAATRFKVIGRFSSTQYQTTNYGLGGLCETHIDPHGYIEGMELTPDRQGLINTGDMIATFMAWLNDVEAGGYTAFDHVNYEQRLEPTRGSAAFWLDLNKKGFRELRSSHMGCPVLKGSKWILNKWIYYYDQFQNYPCGLQSNEPMEAFTKFYV